MLSYTNNAIRCDGEDTQIIDVDISRFPLESNFNLFFTIRKYHFKKKW